MNEKRANENLARFFMYYNRQEFIASHVMLNLFQHLTSVANWIDPETSSG